MAQLFGTEDLPSSAQDLASLLVLVESRRYLEGHDRLPKSTEFRESGTQSLTAKEFRQITRVSHSSFFRIISEIETNRVFHNNSGCGHAPVSLELAVALNRLGNYRNGVRSVNTKALGGRPRDLRSLYDSGSSCFERSRRQVCDVARCRRATINIARMAQSGFRGCVGFIDGTTIPLSQKPAVDGECYFDQRHHYSVNAQVVCDDHRRIIAFFSGWPGSCSDSTVYREMAIANASRKPSFFSQGEFLIADSAYPADVVSNTLVPAYKSNMKGVDIEDFNTCVAHARVVNEHTIGVLKRRQSQGFISTGDTE
ncbi:hypothetical protein L917_10230 [Phytophthora nicotianae]|uniref:DDE Tnp4 domain-containing protein n=1 Tax=Phytophthora nicotianae TaxID=4792 RepID=W2L190_PHYNI|nr:hypothetical protein L917_10230 [Phytophthora nicotianae]